MRQHIIESGSWFGDTLDGPPKFLLVYAASRRAILLERESEHDTDSAMRQKALELESAAMKCNRRDLASRKGKLHNS